MQLQEKITSYQETLESEKEYYEIRLESIGGLGANLCAKMLGELGVKYLDINSSNFSSYGSEKTGTPVKGFIRFCKKEKEIRLHSPVMEPDVLVVFHQALLKEPLVWRGCHSNTKIIIAVEEGRNINQILKDKEKSISEKKRECGSFHKENFDEKKSSLFDKEGGFYAVEAQRIAMETHSRINVVILGSVLRIMGLESPEVGEQICKDTLGRKYPASLQSNLEGLRRGFYEIKRIKIENEESLQSKLRGEKDIKKKISQKVIMDEKDGGNIKKELQKQFF